MKQNTLGRSSVQVSEIGYGCMSLGHDHRENAKLLHRALRPFMPDSYNESYGPDGRRKSAHKHHCGHLERTAVPGHHKPQPHKHVCTRDLWAVPPATRVEDGTPPRYIREFASVSYEVFPLSPDAPAPEYVSALVASLPITNVSVIKAGDGSHKETLEKVREMLE